MGEDVDENDKLSMKIGGLPPELIVSCTKKDQPVRCEVSGVPSKTGEYQMQITLFDNNGAKTEMKKTFLVE